MPRKKIIGKCKVEGCVRELDSLGLCGLHYRRQYYKGRLHLIQDGRRGHRQYYNWASRKDKICEEWKDFWKFIKDVGEEPPSKMHYLRKLVKNEPYGPNNFQWVLHLKRSPNESDKEWNARKWNSRIKKDPDLNRNARTFRKFGIHLKEYSELIKDKMEKQNNTCEICKKFDTRLKKNKKPVRLAVDHCHKTNRIRGLLCSRCNTSLGRLEDSVELLQFMIDYLRKYS